MWGREGRAKVRRLVWREKPRHRQRTDLAFPARVTIVVAGAAIWMCAREGGGRNVAKSFALLINHACFCGVAVAGWTRHWRKVGWAKSCRRPGCGGGGPVSEEVCCMKVRGV